jgi:hypothetical protein
MSGAGGRALHVIACRLPAGRLTAIPAIVQRPVCPVLTAVGTALGRSSKYADAPEPMAER